MLRFVHDENDDGQGAIVRGQSGHGGPNRHQGQERRRIFTYFTFCGTYNELHFLVYFNYLALAQPDSESGSFLLFKICLFGLFLVQINELRQRAKSDLGYLPRNLSPIPKNPGTAHGPGPFETAENPEGILQECVLLREGMEGAAVDVLHIPSDCRDHTASHHPVHIWPQIRVDVKYYYQPNSLTYFRMKSSRTHGHDKEMISGKLITRRGSYDLQPTKL